MAQGIEFKLTDLKLKLQDEFASEAVIKQVTYPDNDSLVIYHLVRYPGNI